MVNDRLTTGDLTGARGPRLSGALAVSRRLVVGIVGHVLKRWLVLLDAIRQLDDFDLAEQRCISIVGLRRSHQFAVRDER